MENVSGKWRGFGWHLGLYVIVIAALGLINLLSEADNPWFLYPATGWGAGIAFHLLGITVASLKGLNAKWRTFLGHLGSYVIVIAMLGVINLLSEADNPWFLWPAVGWGAALAIHFLGSLLGKGQTEAQQQTRQEEGQTGREERRDRHLQQDEPEQEVDTTTRPKKERPPRPVEYPLINKGQTPSVVQGHMAKALAYQAQIDGLIKGVTEPNARARLQTLAGEVAEWVEAIEDLVKRTEDFQSNSLIRQDLESVPQAITNLETQLAQETDPDMRAQLERTLTNRRNQRASLERLQTLMKRAEIQIESTLSALGTIYSQLLADASTNHVADYSRLSAEVDEEVRLLQDRLEALEEVKLGRG